MKWIVENKKTGKRYNVNEFALDIFGTLDVAIVDEITLAECASGSFDIPWEDIDIYTED